jgi:hypothetical protein
MSSGVVLGPLFATSEICVRIAQHRPCTCDVIQLPYADPCPVHVGFINEEGVFMKRYGNSDATGDAYYVGSPVVTVKT